jgi:hypothetical protein
MKARLFELSLFVAGVAVFVEEHLSSFGMKWL